ncbi:hypothetical protein TRFO_32500 [Tritrichomonas foetus]|uniref:Uncharacterized protein n=1 Tax=Tritrichomonas foetus TaxID=1144522 RepID=A0A1J4JTA2_9EUKA|nr:hypothetical protein TRFO_32500 [Tritrichomonas foetus]|eukprot:OHT00724.1 hypothetical protein TRFO_32500 [Tritrichomonas foetus]
MLLFTFILPLINCESLEDLYTNAHQNFIPIRENQLRVSNCVFESCIAQADVAGGGAIYATGIGDHVHFLVDSCSFFACKSEQIGGAIYFAGGDCSFTYVCYSMCSAKEVGSAYFEAINIEQNSMVNHTSHIYIESDNDGMRFYLGEVFFNYFNSSNNRVRDGVSSIHGIRQWFMDFKFVNFNSNQHKTDIALDQGQEGFWYHIKTANFYNFTERPDYMIRMSTSVIIWDGIFQKCGKLIFSAPKSVAQQMIRCVFDEMPIMNRTFQSMTYIPMNLTTPTNDIPLFGTLYCPNNDVSQIPPTKTDPTPYRTITPTPSQSNIPTISAKPSRSPTPAPSETPTPTMSYMPEPTENSNVQKMMIISTSVMGGAIIVGIIVIVVLVMLIKKVLRLENNEEVKKF